MCSQIGYNICNEVGQKLIWKQNDNNKATLSYIYQGPDLQRTKNSLYNSAVLNKISLRRKCIKIANRKNPFNAAHS